MLKMRITFVDDEKGRAELASATGKLEKEFDIISTSKIYKGRSTSKYSNVYIDLEVKNND